MSHTNTTTNYGLPQFLSSDKPAWMADINVAFADIDGQMKTNADAASAAQTTANDAVLNGAPGYSNLSTYAVGDVVNYLGRVYKCDIAVTTPEAFDNAKWSYYRLSDASAQLDVIDGEIGSTDISGIGDGTLSGAISNINSSLYLGTETLLAGTNETSASNTESVPDLNQFKFLMICAGTPSGAIYNPALITINDFKANRVSATTRVLINAYVGGSEQNVSCYYVDDTTIGLYTTNTYARVYGIK